VRWGLPVEERFWAHVHKGAPEDCWLWKGVWSADPGGPSFRISKKPSVKMRVNRFAWMLTHGEIPQKKIVAQTCGNKACCNPAHLYLDTTEARKALCRAADERRRQERKLFVISHKQKCLRCGFSENPVALQFHHRDPALKSFELSKSKNKTLEILKEEIAKCDVLCANCHAIVEDDLRKAA
jgi:HNH endonuclease